MDTATPRRLDLDWIRIAAFGLLIAYHVGMYYVTWDWHIKSPFASGAIEPLMLAVNPWRLSLLFLISGCAAAFLLRDGANFGRIARQRSRFLLVPLVFGMLVVVPPQSYYEVVDKFGFADGYLAFWRRYLAADRTFCSKECLILPTWNHLWFVVYLWVYTMLLIALRRWVPRVRLAGWKLLLAPWLALALARVLLAPRFGSTHALVDDWYNHAQYLLVFALGYVIARDEEVWTWLSARRGSLLAIALAAYSALLAYVLHVSDANPPSDALRAVMRIDYALLQWSAILAVLGWGRHLLGAARDTPLRAYLTDAVFCYYIVHQTAIVVTAHAMRPWALPPPVEAPLLIATTLATCALSYEIVRRVPLLQPLFGVRSGLDRNRILRYRTFP